MGGWMYSSRHLLGGTAHGSNHPIVSATPAEMAFQALADLVIGGLRIVHEQRYGGHDQASGAKATLRSLFGEKGLLDRVKGLHSPQSLHGRHGFALNRADRQLAGRHCCAIDDHFARAALFQAAAKLSPFEVQVIAQHIEQRGVRLDLDLARVIVDAQDK
jgi:hypothetical protein